MTEMKKVMIALLQYDASIKQIPRHHWIFVLQYLAGTSDFCSSGLKKVIEEAREHGTFKGLPLADLSVAQVGENVK